MEEREGGDTEIAMHTNVNVICQYESVEVTVIAMFSRLSSHIPSESKIIAQVKLNGLIWMAGEYGVTK